MTVDAEQHQPRSRSNLRRFWDTVFIGDWHPWLRDPLDVFRLSFGVGAVIFALEGDWDAFVRLLLPGVLVCLIRALDVPRPIDLQEYQAWRAIDEGVVEVFEGLLLVAKLRIGAREVQR